jgi:hypothetical protein
MCERAFGRTSLVARVKIESRGGSWVGVAGVVLCGGEWFEVDRVPELLELADDFPRALSLTEPDNSDNPTTIASNPA